MNEQRGGGTWRSLVGAERRSAGAIGWELPITLCRRHICTVVSSSATQLVNKYTLSMDYMHRLHSAAGLGKSRGWLRLLYSPCPISLQQALWSRLASRDSPAVCCPAALFRCVLTRQGSLFHQADIPLGATASLSQGSLAQHSSLLTLTVILGSVCTWLVDCGGLQFTLPWD